VNDHVIVDENSHGARCRVTATYGPRGPGELCMTGGIYQNLLCEACKKKGTVAKTCQLKIGVSLDLVSQCEQHNYTHSSTDIT